MQVAKLNRKNVGKKFFCSPSSYSYKNTKQTRIQEIKKLREIYQQEIFNEQLKNENCEPLPSGSEHTLESVGMSKEDALILLDSALTTMALHTESRIASLMGQGFYTIGPCGEELIAAVGAILKPTDPIALHYRHIGAQVSRQLKAGRKLEDIIMDRVRGYVVSVNDPATAAVHCAIGGGPYDFLVTSTLSSQALPAVGRALGNSLAHLLKISKPMLEKNSVSFVSVGDGSVNHSHFLSAINLSEYASFRNYKIPVLFGISDNDISISLRGYKWLSEWVKKLRMPLYTANGLDILDIWKNTKDAVEYVRGQNKPATIVYQNLPRRFGHAATDRQSAYYSEQEISSAENKNPVSYLVDQLVQLDVVTYQYVRERFDAITQIIENAFEEAVLEPKIKERAPLMARNSAPLVSVQGRTQSSEQTRQLTSGDYHPMRKHMTEVIDEQLGKNKNLVYIGEDVVHGGYYLVTDGLAKKYPYRVADFPPEEAALLGAAIGYAQAGLVPIIEIPYAKYLDCGIDIFYEAIYANWYSNGKQPNGMIIRLQGFGKGIFGGNFHTHNSLYLPPGLDVVCYSNGVDYAKGFRYAVEQAKGGRVVMFVDCTNLLNLRHIYAEGDRKWLFPFTEKDEIMTWDMVRSYGEGKKLAIVTYGNSVLSSLNAKQRLEDDYKFEGITVIDCPYISSPPQGLVDALKDFECVLFADDCKQGQNPFSGMISSLQSQQALPRDWLSVAALPTYNPLGTTLTFTSVEDIYDGCVRLLTSRNMISTKKNNE